MLPSPPQPPPAPSAFVSSPVGTSQLGSQLGNVHSMLDQLLGGAQPKLPLTTLDGSQGDGVSPMQTDASAASDAVTAGAGAGAGGAAAAQHDSQRCMDIIDTIRREEFGMGVELDAASSQLRHKQNERIGRALQRLSQELYSKDTHFVLELVQNADDNTYPSGVLPALEFILQDSGITVLNNEV